MNEEKPLKEAKPPLIARIIRWLLLHPVKWLVAKAQQIVDALPDPDEIFESSNRRK